MIWKIEQVIIVQFIQVGTKEYLKNNNRHNETSAAMHYFDGFKTYWLNDVCYSQINTDEEWIRFQKLIVFS